MALAEGVDRTPAPTTVAVAGLDSTARRFNLVRRLMMTGLAAFLFTATSLVLLYRYDQLAEHRELFGKESEQSAQQLVTALGTRMASFIPTMDALDAGALRAHQDVRLLDEMLAGKLPPSILKIKLFSPGGKLLYSSVHDEIGSMNHNREQLARAMQGETQHKEEFRELFRAGRGDLPHRYVLQTYLPMRQDGIIVGVFEVYADMTAIVERVNSRTIEIAFLVAAIFAGLCAALLVSARRADRALNLWQDQIVASEASLRLYASVFQHSGEAILISDHNNKIVAVNNGFTALTGYSAADVLGKNPRMLSSGLTPRETFQNMWASIAAEDYWQGELSDRSKSGRIYPKWLSVSVVRDPSGTLTHFVGSFVDISERKAAEERMSHLAHHDALTGLINRFSLLERLEQAVGSAKRERRALAVMFIDMDRFKTVNDTLGHAVGDGLLTAVAHRLVDNVRDSDIVARIGGDEFVVVLTEVDSATAAARVANKILLALGQAYRIGTHSVYSTPSIGLAFMPDDSDDAETLLKFADTAMYHAKSQGRNNVQFFTATMNQAAVERLKLEQDLHTALDQSQFELQYQPQVETSPALGEQPETGRHRITGVEALIRWRHPQRGLLAPQSFIALAEDTGLILPLGEWVLNEACRQLRSWRDSGFCELGEFSEFSEFADFGVAINLSSHQLRSLSLCRFIADVLERYHLSGADIEIEITESAVMSDPAASIETLNALREMGIRLAIDDFGTGYSSLSYLKLLPIHTLKIDEAFVRDLETDANDVAICKATIALAHNLGLTVVAEGVETEAQRVYLAAQGCDRLQGFLFAEPMAGDAIPAFVAAWNRDARGDARAVAHGKNAASSFEKEGLANFAVK